MTLLEGKNAVIYGAAGHPGAAIARTSPAREPGCTWPDARVSATWTARVAPAGFRSIVSVAPAASPSRLPRVPPPARRAVADAWAKGPVHRCADRPRADDEARDALQDRTDPLDLAGRARGVGRG